MARLACLAVFQRTLQAMWDGQNGHPLSRGLTVTAQTARMQFSVALYGLTVSRPVISVSRLRNFIRLTRFSITRSVFHSLHIDPCTTGTCKGGTATGHCVPQTANIKKAASRDRGITPRHGRPPLSYIVALPLRPFTVRCDASLPAIRAGGLSMWQAA